MGHRGIALGIEARQTVKFKTCLLNVLSSLSSLPTRLHQVPPLHSLSLQDPPTPAGGIPVWDELSPHLDCELQGDRARALSHQLCPYHRAGTQGTSGTWLRSPLSSQVSHRWGERRSHTVGCPTPSEAEQPGASEPHRPESQLPCAGLCGPGQWLPLSGTQHPQQQHKARTLLRFCSIWNIKHLALHQCSRPSKLPVLLLSHLTTTEIWE